MGLFRNFFVTFCFLLCSKADTPPACVGSIQFNPTGNISAILQYPVNFSQPFSEGYNCAYQINVPQGWSAYIVLNAKPASATNAPIIQVVDFNQRVENLTSAQDEPFYFVAPGGTIKLSTQTTTVAFTFSVQWSPAIPILDYVYANVSFSDTQPFVPFASSTGGQITQVTASTRVSLVMLPPRAGQYQGKNLKMFRGILFFDGLNENSTCLGTAYQLLNADQQYVSTGRVVTVIPLLPLGAEMVEIMFQDFENTKDIGQYRGIGCVGGNCDPIVMDASKSMSAFSTYSFTARDDECLMGITGTGSLEVYYGGKTKTKSNLIASYDASNHTSMFPQLIRGVVRTYVLTGGIATVNLSQVFGAYACHHINENRVGFISSSAYKTGISLPYVNDGLYYDSVGPFNFSLMIQDVDLSRSILESKSLQLRIIRNKTEVLNVVYNSTTPPKVNTLVGGIGNNVEVLYSTDGLSPTKGFFISYTATRVNVACYNSFYFLVPWALFLLF